MRSYASIVFVVAACLACAFALPVSAQTVYRCGPDGRSYTQQPCDEGKAVRVDDARSDAQRREAESTSRRDARMARNLERERLAMKPASSGAVGIDSRGRPAVEPTKPAAAKKRRKSPANG